MVMPSPKYDRAPSLRGTDVCLFSVRLSGRPSKPQQPLLSSASAQLCFAHRKARVSHHGFVPLAVINTLFCR